MTRQTQRFTSPIIRDRKGDLSKDWYIEYSYFIDLKEGQKRRFQVKGKINSFSTLEMRSKEAKRLRGEIENKLKNGFNPLEHKDQTYIDLTVAGYKGKPKEKDYSLIQALNEALLLKKGELRPKSMKDYQTNLRLFREWLYSQGLGEIPAYLFTPELAEKFFMIHLADKQSATKRRYLIVLKQLFSKIVERGIIDKNPLNGIKIKKTKPTKNKRYFTDTQVELLKAHLIKDPILWLPVQAIYYCGARPKEAGALKISDIDLETGKLTMNGQITKNKQTRIVDIPNVFFSTLKEYIQNELKIRQSGDYLFVNPRGKKLSENYLDQRHRALLKRLNLYNGSYSLYSWRHTGVVRFYKECKDIKAVQAHLGHSEINITDMYLHSLGQYDNEQAKNNFPKL